VGKKMKKIIVALLIMCPLLIGCKSGDVEEKSTDTETVSNESSFKDVSKDGLTYRNSSFETGVDGTTIITEIENTGDDERTITSIYLDLKDEDGNVVDTLESYVGQTIKTNDSATSITKTDADLSNVKSIDYSSK
jgi:hypothetical protein